MHHKLFLFIFLTLTGGAAEELVDSGHVGWAHYEGLYQGAAVKVDEVDRHNSFLTLGESYENEGDWQNAIWLYREIGELKKAQRLEMMAEHLLLTSAPQYENGRIKGRPALTSRRNRQVPSPHASIVEVTANVAAVLRPRDAQIYTKEFDSEAIAYHIDRILRLNVVPVTVTRTFNDRHYSVQLMVKNRKLNDYYEFNTNFLDNVYGRNSYPIDGWRIFILDFLMGVHDRSPANWFLRPGSGYVAIDNDALFYESPQDIIRLTMNKDVLTAIPVEFLMKLELTDFGFLSPYLSAKALSALRSRKEILINAYSMTGRTCTALLRN